MGISQPRSFAGYRVPAKAAGLAYRVAGAGSRLNSAGTGTSPTHGRNLLIRMFDAGPFRRALVVGGPVERRSGRPRYLAEPAFSQWFRTEAQMTRMTATPKAIVTASATSISPHLRYAAFLGPDPQTRVAVKSLTALSAREAPSG